MRQTYEKNYTLAVKNKRNFFPLRHEIGEYHKRNGKRKIICIERKTVKESRNK